MSRVTLLSGVLALGIGAAPAGVALGLAMVQPTSARSWVLCFVALSLAMIGTAFGPDWVEGWQRRRRAHARVRAALARGAEAGPTPS
ncbi:hypothetical protein ACIA8O_08555 [Kitasatospora sp. NPDC051853]|uniref:hypothetical protein n=1 Tax=Kitasatospora sp. NPDC051853 TaxID=3364058 RepID=UPI0037969169